MRLAHSAAPILRPASLAAGMTKTLRKGVLSRILPFMLQLSATIWSATHREVIRVHRASDQLRWKNVDIRRSLNALRSHDVHGPSITR